MSQRGYGGGGGGGGYGGRRDGPQGAPERVNQALVVDTGFVEPSRGASNICFEFQRSGACRQGDACRFAHAQQPQSASLPGAAGAQKPWLAMSGAKVVRGADGALELVAPAAAELQRGVDGALGDKHKPDGHRERKRAREEKRARKAERKERRQKDEKDGHSKRTKGAKRRRRSSGSSSSSESEDAGAAAVPRAALSGEDYFLRNHEFSAWLQSTRKTFFTALQASEARALFDTFAGEWNAGKLPKKLYSGLTVAGRR